MTWFYNYAGFSAEYLNNYQTLLTNPDYVAQKGYLAIASGIWFLMTPQPPKPSMHDVIVGTYKPVGAAQGVVIDPADGSVLNKFEATVSIINGGYECSPAALLTLQQSKNRFTYYKALLEYLGATLTPVEAAYVPDTTYCQMPRGNPGAIPN